MANPLKDVHKPRAPATGWLDASAGYLALAISAIVLAVSLSACEIRIGDPGPRGEVGVSVKGDRVLFRVNPCDADARVQVVDLRTATGKPGKEGDLLWEIRAEDGSGLRDYDLGKTPKGFVETMKLGAFERSGEYVVRVKLVSTGLELSTGFVPDSLEESVWLDSLGDFLTDEQFGDLSPCD